MSRVQLMPDAQARLYIFWALGFSQLLVHSLLTRGPMSVQTQPMSRAGRISQPASQYPLSLWSASRQQRGMVKGQVSRHAQRRTSSGQCSLQTQMRTSLLLHSPYKGIAAVHSSRLAPQPALQMWGRCQMARMQHQINCTRAWRMRPGATLSRCMQQPLIQCVSSRSSPWQLLHPLKSLFRTASWRHGSLMMRRPCQSRELLIRTPGQQVLGGPPPRHPPQACPPARTTAPHRGIRPATSSRTRARVGGPQRWWGSNTTTRQGSCTTPPWGLSTMSKRGSLEMQPLASGTVCKMATTAWYPKQRPGSHHAKRSAAPHRKP